MKILQVPPLKSMMVARTIKHLSPVERVTKLLQGEEDIPQAAVKLHSPNQMTMIRNLILKVECDATTEISIFLNSNPGNVLHRNEHIEYHDFVVAPNCTLECYAKLCYWKPELEFPDMHFYVNVFYESPLEVIDG